MSEQERMPESNLSYLREHQAQLRHTSASVDLSEISYHTDQTEFPGSRHSSLNTEPLTLDAEQIHEAKDEAIDILRRADAKTAFDIFTKDSLSTLLGRVSMMEYFWRLDGQDSQGKCEPVQQDTDDVSQQIDSLQERTHQEVEANQKISQAIANPPDPSVPASSHQDVKKRQSQTQQLSSPVSAEQDLKKRQDESEQSEKSAVTSISSEQDVKEKKD